MARSSVYDKPLFVNVLSGAGNSEHEIRFNEFLTIKKEAEDELLDGKIETTEAAAAGTRNLSDTQGSEIRFQDLPVEANKGASPKLKIKFTDLWKKSEEKVYHAKRKKKDMEKESNDNFLTIRKLSGDEKRKSEMIISLDDRTIQPSLLTERKNEKSTSSSFEQKAAPHKDKAEDVWNIGQVSCLRKKLNIVCETCGMSFSHKNQLQAHIRYYTLDGNYHCTICDLRYRRSAQLSRHMKIAHTAEGDRDVYRFKCPFCLDCFKRRASYVQHITHFHIKCVVTYKECIHFHEEPALLQRTRFEERKKTGVAKYKRVRENEVQMDSEDREITLNDESELALNQNKSVTSGLTDNAEVSNQGTLALKHDHNTLLKKIDDGDLTANNVNRGLNLRPKTPKTSEPTTGHLMQSDVNKSANRLSRKRSFHQPSVGDTSNSVPRLCVDITTIQKLQKHNKQRMKTKDTNLADMDSLSKNPSPNVGEISVNCSGNSVENLSILDPPGNRGDTDNSREHNNSRTIVDRANESPIMTIHNMFGRTRSSTLKMSTLNSSMPNVTNVAAQTDQLLPKKESSILEQSTNDTAIDRIIDEACSHLESVHEDAVGAGSLRQVSEDLRTTGRRMDGEGSVCSIVGMNFIQGDDVRKTYDAGVGNCKGGNTSFGNYEPISPGKLAIPNISTTGSSSLGSHGVTTPPCCDSLNYVKIRDVKVLLVRLESMSNLSTNNSSENSSKNLRSVKTEKPDREPNDQRFTNERVSGGKPRREHDFAEIEPDERSILISERNHVSNSCHSKPAANNRMQSRAKFKREKRCYLCHKVFHNHTMVLPHYFSVHIKAGVLRCCLCHANFRRKKNLKLHLLKNYRSSTKKLCIQFCVVCKKVLHVDDLNHRCSECNRSSEVMGCEPLKKPFPVAKNSTQTIRNGEIHRLENRSVSVFGLPPVPISGNRTSSDSVMIDRKSTKSDHEILLLRDREEIDKHSLLTSGSRKNGNSKSGGMNRHDKFCKRGSLVRGKLRLIQRNRANEHSMRQRCTNGSNNRRQTHTCDVCKLRCCCPKSLRTHKIRHSTNGNYLCSTCNLTFSESRVLAAHITTAHNPNNFYRGGFRCEICNQGFYNSKFLRIHLAHFHNLKYFQCTICRIRFGSRRSLNNHKRYYSTNLSFNCITCDQSFKCKYMLEYHKAQVHDRGKSKTYKYFCDVCTFASIDEELLQAHVGHNHRNYAEAETTANNNEQLGIAEQLPEDIENKGKETICVNSNVQSSNSAMEKQKTSHDTLDRTNRTRTPSEYKCGICNLGFRDPYAILNHEWEFSNDGAYTCEVCNRKFVTNALLESHKAKHYHRNLMRKYECYICKEDFSRLDHLKMHGLHLHGPKFLLQKNIKTNNICDENVSNPQIKCYTDDTLKKPSNIDTHKAVELMADDEVDQSGMILFFQRTTSHRYSLKLSRRHSTGDTYRCHFCETDFNSALLLRDHLKKHAYRAYYTNSSKYLCLICKTKFRTNDVLRAHVIHCHTPDQKKEDLSELGCPEEYILNESVKNGINSGTEQGGIIRGDKKTTKPGSEDISTRKKRNHLSNFLENSDDSQRNRIINTVLHHEMANNTEHHVRCNDLDNDCGNFGCSNVLGSRNLRINGHMKPNTAA